MRPAADSKLTRREGRRHFGYLLLHSYGQVLQSLLRKLLEGYARDGFLESQTTDAQQGDRKSPALQIGKGPAQAVRQGCADQHDRCAVAKVVGLLLQNPLNRRMRHTHA